MVGVAGLEPTTSCTPCMRASQLRYTPMCDNDSGFFFFGNVLSQLFESFSYFLSGSGELRNLKQSGFENHMRISSKKFCF